MFQIQHGMYKNDIDNHGKKMRQLEHPQQQKIENPL